MPRRSVPTEELLHGHLAAIDEDVRCFVLEEAGRAVERAAQAAAALEILGRDVTLVRDVQSADIGHRPARHSTSPLRAASTRPDPLGRPALEEGRDAYVEAASLEAGWSRRR